MSSSIFSSKAAPSIALGWIFLSAFLLLVGVGRIIDQRFPMWRMTTPFQSGIPSLGTKWLLSNLINVMEYDAYLHDLAGTTEYMRKAEVLFLGNSRALYGFRPEGYQPHLDRYGLRGYTLAFHGTDLIPLELIRRYDLRPKLLIISSDGFFVDGWQRLTRIEQEPQLLGRLEILFRERGRLGDRVSNAQVDTGLAPVPLSARQSCGLPIHRNRRHLFSLRLAESTATHGTVARRRYSRRGGNERTTFF